MSGSSQAKMAAPLVNRAVETRPAVDRAGQGRGLSSTDPRGWPPSSCAPSRCSGAAHAFGQVRLSQDLPKQIQARLEIGKAGDPYETEADRAADRALGAATPSTRRPSSVVLPASAQVQARSIPGAIPTAAPGLAGQIEAARPEGRPLPTEQRTFFEGRLGHDFSAVRVHAGPAAATAAASAGAQAFTHGQNIYFGAGYYRPDTATGQWLMAHELAHTAQQRPGVIARQALAETAVAEPPASPELSGEPVEPLANNLLALWRSGAPEGNVLVRQRLAAMDTPTRLAVAARVRSELPPPDRPLVSDILERALTQETAARPPLVPVQTPTDAGQASPVSAAPAARTARQAPTLPAVAPPSVKRSPEPAPPGGPSAASGPAATAASAKDMQTAIQAATAGAAATAEPSAPEGEAGPAPQGAVGGGPSGGPAEVAAQAALSAFGDQLSQLAQIRGSRIGFAAGESYAMDPAEISRREQSESMATTFVQGVAQRLEPIIAGALKAVPQLMASLTAARDAVSKTVVEQVAAVHEGAETARKRAGAESRQTRGHIQKKRGDSEAAIDKGAQRAQDRAKAAQKTADGDIDKQSKDAIDDVEKRYREAVTPTQQVGVNAGNAARGAANAKAASYRTYPPKNGESSILDGPIHDDRLDARADTAEKIGESYAKSFGESADEQATKLPDSKPGVLDKISEITGQAKTGLNDQARQMNEGVVGFSKGAKARAKQTSGRLQAAAAGSGKQAVEALNADETEHTANLQAQGTAQAQGLDEAVSSGLATLTEGLTGAIGQVTNAMYEFKDSAADMQAPEPEKLSPVLADVTGQSTTALSGMDQQVQTIVPSMNETLGTACDGTVKALTQTATAARDQSRSTADSLARNMRGLGGQATKGFDSLIDGDTKTADSMGKNAELGFRDASSGSRDAFKLFGNKVDESLSNGRTQIFNSLWGKQNQDKLDKDIRDYGDKAADAVQPRWKKVLKWVITIAVIIAVVAITIVSAGSLGPVGVILLGAALGAAAGAVTTIAHNLIDGKKWSDGVAKAMIVGAIGGAFGGAGGVIVKGVGSAALKIGIEAGINVVGGITGEVIGSAAVGETINWSSALTGALIGAGIGAGLGIAGALKGKIRLGSSVEAPAAPQVRPTIEPLPPAGRVRTVLENAKILAPRRPPAPPAGAGAAGVTEPAGVGSAREAAPPAQPRPPGVQPQPEPRIGFGREAAREAQPRPPGAAPTEEPRIGFGREAAREAQPRPPGAAPTEEPRIGFGREAAREAQPRPPGAAPTEEPRIGFGPEREAARQAQPRPPTAQGTAGPEASLTGDLSGPAATGQPTIIEVRPPRAAAPITGGEPVQLGGRAPEVTSGGGGRAPEVNATASAGGGRGSRATSAGTPRRGRVTPIKETAPAQRSTVNESAAVSEGAPAQGPARKGAAAVDQGTQAPGTPAQEPAAAGKGAPARKDPTGGPRPDKPASPRRRPPADLPEYPQFPEGVGRRAPNDALGFFRQNRNAYPREIRDAIDQARPGVRTDVENIDRLIRNAQAARANEALGFRPVSEPLTRPGSTGRPITEPSSPFTRTTKGHQPGVEGTEFEAGATLGKGGVRKNLTYEGQTKTGERIQIDDFDFRLRAGKEVKMPLAIAEDPRYFAQNFPKVVDQMRRQAQFIRDWGFTKYTWEMYSTADKMTAARALAELPGDLARFIEIVTIH